MKHLRLCCVAPHAPILVPDIGRDDLAEVPGTCDALGALAREIDALGPDTVVIVSPPHLRLASRDAFPVKTGRSFFGDLSRFRAPGSAVSLRTDGVLLDALTETARLAGVPLHRDTGEREDDWGALVPLLLLAPPSAQIVAINACPHLGYSEHALLGAALRDAVEESGRNAVFIASGDMSHRLKPGAPSGYSPRGKEFDLAVVEAMRSGDLGAVFNIDPRLSDEAGEDCLWSLAVLAGTIEGHDAEIEVLSYEGSFGVGYMVARVMPGGKGARGRPAAV